MSAILDDVLVVDFSRVIAGPYCSQVLGDLGASVVKVEEPEVGDEVRHIAPFYPAGESHYFLSLNRNKQSVVVDLKHPEGRQFVLDLVAQADVVVENFRPGVMDRLGLGFEALRAVNPDIVMCSISGYGQDGPLRNAPAFDLIAQARSGVMSINGEPGTGPTKLGLPVGDLGGGMWAAIAILGALRARDRDGGAQHIDISLLGGLIAMENYLSQMAILTGQAPTQTGSDHHNVAPYGRYRARDGYLVLAVLVGSFWAKLCRAIQRPDLVEDPRFATGPDRREHRVELREILEAVLVQRTRAEWSVIFTAHDVPHGPVLDVVEALAEPQVAARGLLRTMTHPTEGTVTVVGPPIRINGRSTAADLAPAPLLGEHTADVATKVVGLDEARLRHLVSVGAVHVRTGPEDSAGLDGGAEGGDPPT